MIKNFAFLTRHIQNLRGGSQPILAQASDGLLYVVKFTNNAQGANLCFNESAGSELYRAFGLPVPLWKPLLVTESFVDRNPDCWMQTPAGRLRPDSGFCFGSRFLGREGVRLLEVLPGNGFQRIRNREEFWLAWLIDICADHADNRQAIFLEDSRHNLEAFFIDLGHLFGGPTGEQEPRLLASRYLDPRIYAGVSSQYLLTLEEVTRRLDADRLWQQINMLPENWKTVPALDAFAQCLCRFSSSGLIQSQLHVMAEIQRQADENEYGKWESRREPPASVLRFGVPAAKLGYSRAARCAGHPARA